MIRLVFFVLLVGCSKSPDDCERAIDRLKRLEKPGAPAMNKAARVESCRAGTLSSWDPVLRCAMDSATDEAADACIKRGIDSVLNGATTNGDGSGVNPLLR